MNLMDAHIGQELTFNYNAGSKPGTMRRVKVLEKHPDRSAGSLGYIVAEDLEDNNQPKNFAVAYAENVEVVVPPEEPVAKKAIVSRIPFIQARNDLIKDIDKTCSWLFNIPSEELAELYAKYFLDNEEAEVQFDIVTGEIVISKPKIEPYFTTDGDGDLVIVNDQKHGLIIEGVDDQVIVHECNEYGETGPDLISKTVGPEELVRTLMAHMGID